MRRLASPEGSCEILASPLQRKERSAEWTIGHIDLGAPIAYEAEALASSIDCKTRSLPC